MLRDWSERGNLRFEPAAGRAIRLSAAPSQGTRAVTRGRSISGNRFRSPPPGACWANAITDVVRSPDFLVVDVSDRTQTPILGGRRNHPSSNSDASMVRSRTNVSVRQFGARPRLSDASILANHGISSSLGNDTRKSRGHRCRMAGPKYEALVPRFADFYGCRAYCRERTCSLLTRQTCLASEFCANKDSAGRAATRAG